MNRRRFIGELGGVMAGLVSPLGCAPTTFAEQLAAAARRNNQQDVACQSGPGGRQRRKLILVVFGGGTRFSESVGDHQHRFIPKLWGQMVPRGTLFTNVRVEGRVVHTNCTASLLTGHREYDADNDWSRPVEHPTFFERYRKARAAPDTAAWAFVYASILSSIGWSNAAGFGPAYGANVVAPPTIARETAERIAARLQKAAATGSAAEELKAADEAAQWARAESHLNHHGLRSEAARQFLDQQFEAWKSASGTTSHDAFLTDRAIACMKQFAPGVLVLALGEIDCAHYGSWSRYVEAIQRTDELTWRLWRAAEELPEYRGRTLMLILPDHGRELERPGGMGYVHHSNFYTREGEDEGCRRVWLVMLGPGIAQGRTVKTEAAQTAVAATALEYLGLEPSPGATPSLLPLARPARSDLQGAAIRSRRSRREAQNLFTSAQTEPPHVSSYASGRWRGAD